MRSKLFVPGSRGELFAKAFAGDADAVSFDLEDSVPGSGKAAARERVAGFLKGLDPGTKMLVVRTNAVDSAHFDEDFRALALPCVDLLNLPKTEDPEALHGVGERLDALEREHGRRMPGLLVNIETPRGLRRAPSLAAAHPRVRGLQLGLGDLFESQGIDRDDHAAVHAVQLAVRMAAGEADVFAWDGAHPDLERPERFLAEARIAQRLGYCGKSCVHPRQVGWAHEVFSLPPMDVELARRIVAAAEEAQAQGRGAFVVDGRMVDLPYLQHARRALVWSAEKANA
ncbi:CoA ester lyase [Pseudoxanthomonas broegbernensis]|uniref:CoA ester lyase n=1 Tax=Pseudoxanthomonas broegbernensis TaxID=83619 RepID=A0A7V8GLG8_9GAMM|nr:CoA ester lyase [Pseudoxanthomonas broegbernensis]KAF1685845.1 CoA ester lyase [Pseudoxanthomonas broegbernensis]MBB6064059.1 citrate lyase subunit beta/citryl-CoA lyase [Pseudoxanthomonas broegbernensis]